MQTKELKRRLLEAIRLNEHGDFAGSLSIMRTIAILEQPKPRKRGKRFGESGHCDEVCYCVNCVPIRIREADEVEAAMVADGRLSPTWKTDKAIDPMAGPGLESVESIATRLTYCDCGHAGERHETDKLGNLLRCKAHNPNQFGGMDCCPCDHFHYSTESEAIPNEAA